MPLDQDAVAAQLERLDAVRAVLLSQVIPRMLPVVAFQLAEALSGIHIGITAGDERRALECLAAAHNLLQHAGVPQDVLAIFTRPYWRPLH